MPKVSQIKAKNMLNLMTSKKEAWVHATLRENRVKLLCSKLIKGGLSHILNVFEIDLKVDRLLAKFPSKYLPDLINKRK